MENEEKFASLKHALKCLGLSDLDIAAYLIIADQGHISVSSLSRLLRVERPTVYSILERLESAKLMSQRKANENAKVFVESPKQVFRLLDQHIHSLQSVKKNLCNGLPELMENFSAKIQDPIIKVFSIRSVTSPLGEGDRLEDIKSDILFFGDCSTLCKLAKDKLWDESIKNTKRKLRILCHQTEEVSKILGLDMPINWEASFLPGEKILKGLFVCYDSTLIFINPLIERKIIIKDFSTAEMFTYIFEKFWLLAKLNDSAQS